MVLQNFDFAIELKSLVVSLSVPSCSRRKIIIFFNISGCSMLASSFSVTSWLNCISISQTFLTRNYMIELHSQRGNLITQKLVQSSCKLFSGSSHLIDLNVYTLLDSLLRVI